MTPKTLTRALLLLAYGALCVLDFLVSWAKDWTSEQLKGPPPEEPKP